MRWLCSLRAWSVLTILLELAFPPHGLALLDPSQNLGARLRSCRNPVCAFDVKCRSSMLQNLALAWVSRNLPWHCALARSCERHVRASGFTFIFKLEGFCLKDCASPAAGFQRSSHWTINNRIKAKGISCRLQETFQELITVAYT